MRNKLRVQHFAFVGFFLSLAGVACGGNFGGILIVTPSSGSLVASENVPAQVSILGNTCDTSYRATLDRNDVTQMFTPPTPPASTVQATLAVLPGDHTLAATVQSGPFCFQSVAVSTFCSIGCPTIYVADKNGLLPAIERIVIIRDTTGAGWTTIGTNGSGAYQFAGMAGVAVANNPQGVYVADVGNRRIAYMDLSGGSWTTLSLPFQPQGINVDSSARIYVTAAGSIVRMDDPPGLCESRVSSHPPTGIVNLTESR